MTSPESLSWRDRWVIALDYVEYFLRRMRCRVIGHKWTTEYEWAGDASYVVGYYCVRCHRFQL